MRFPCQWQLPLRAGPARLLAYHKRQARHGGRAYTGRIPMDCRTYNHPRSMTPGRYISA